LSFCRVCRQEIANKMIVVEAFSDFTGKCSCINLLGRVDSEYEVDTRDLNIPCPDQVAYEVGMNRVGNDKHEMGNGNTTRCLSMFGFV
jgi:hypothetical protein